MSYVIFILIEKSWQASYAKNSRKSFFWVVKIQNLRLKMVVKMASLPPQMLSNRQVFQYPNLIPYILSRIFEDFTKNSKNLQV